MSITEPSNDSKESPQVRPAVKPSWPVIAVVLLGASYSFMTALLGDRQNSSALWFLDAVLVALFLVGVVLRRRGTLSPVWAIHPRRAAVAYVALSWLAAMAYELSLRTGTTGFGGMHPSTITSFVYAQGYYLPLAVGSLWLLRRFHYDFNWVFWTGCLTALYEMITVGGAAIAGGALPVVLIPSLIGYYLMIYGMYLALPLLLIDERSLWSASGRTIRPFWRVVIGVVFGLLLWLGFVAWAAVADSIAAVLR